MRIVYLMILGVALCATPVFAAPKQQQSDPGKRGSQLAQKLNPFDKPNLAHLSVASIAPYLAFSAIFCAAGGLIGKAAFSKAELTNEQALSVAATCFLPGLGPILVKQAFKRHPEWNRMHCAPMTRDAADLMKISGAEPRCWEDK